MLTNFGLTRQEATIYLLLFAEGNMNGYEVSKISGISRSNTYNALAGLVEKGAAYVIQGNAVSYTPVDIKEFCDNKIRFIEESKEKLIKNVPTKREESDAYITIKSEKHIIDKMKNMIIGANERVYIAMDKERLEKVNKELNELSERNIKVSIMTDSKFSLKEATIYYRDKKPNQVRVIVDSKKVLTGEISDKENSTCLYSTNNNLVEVFKEALANEIKLIEIGEGCV